VGSQGHLLVLEQSSWQPSEIPFSADVGSGSEKHFHVVFSSKFEEPSEIFVSDLEIKVSSLCFVEIPHDIHTHSIEAHSFDHFDPVLPILPRYPRVVQLSRIERHVLCYTPLCGVDPLHQFFALEEEAQNN
jgi:hypothetical protein